MREKWAGCGDAILLPIGRAREGKGIHLKGARERQ